MKRLIFLFVILAFLPLTAQTVVKGKVFNSETKEPLQFANIVIEGTSQGTATDENGFFELKFAYDNPVKLRISYIGFETKVISIEKNKTLNIYLAKNILASQTILVQTGIGEKGKSPIAFSKINREEIEKDYTVQDVPEYLSYLPSTTFYSEGGNGIGYNYLSIRGFDQRRISISVNGIPQNDPEDHNLYWVDMPSLLGNAELIQVQRGAGSGVNGYPAIGGSINIITSSFPQKRAFTLSSSLGDYNTRKYGASFASGLIENKYSLYVNLTNVLSSGYRDLSWANFKSYYISAVRFDDKLTSQINIYGGPIKDGLVYNGLPKPVIKDKTLRRENYSYWDYDYENDEYYSWSLKRRPDEIENFSQPHFELLNEYKLNDNVTFNSALFLVIGEGFFDYDGSWSVFYDDYFRLKENGFDSTKTPTNALIRAQVENKQWGWIPRFSWTHGNGTLVTGAEIRNHRSVHWGSIGYAENLPEGVTKDYRYYYYEGGKDIYNFFVNENYNLSEKLNLLGEAQFAYNKYILTNEKYVGNDFTVSNFFVNPRFGINYRFNNNLSSYFSFANVSREPRLKNYYDAAESSAGEIPQFELDDEGNYDFSKPLVKPETMNSFDLGMNFESPELSGSLNFYYMIFNDEIVKKGQVDRFGQPITGNVDKTIHSGVEVSLRYKPVKSFEIIANGSYGKNYISSGSAYIKANGNYVPLDLTGNRISGFPDLTFNGIVRFSYSGFFAQLSAKFVGDFYSDNFDENLSDYLEKYPGFADYNDNKVDAFFTANFLASYEISLSPVFEKIKIFAQVNNIFDNLYAAYAIGKEFFPAAERNFLAGISVSF